MIPSSAVPNNTKQSIITETRAMVTQAMVTHNCLLKILPFGGILYGYKPVKIKI